MAQHIAIFGLHNRDDNMTLRKEITKSRNEMYDDVAKSSNQEDIERIIECIDEIEKLITENDFNAAMRLSRLEDRMDHVEFDTKVTTIGGTIKLGTPPDLPEPFPGYNDLLEEAIPVIKAAIAEKKRELAHRVFPMKVSEN